MSTAFPIRNDTDLARAVALIEELWDAEPGSPESDLREVMAALVDRYEAARSALPAGDPVELIRFKLRERRMSQRELGRALGWGAGRVSEVLSRKRPLTLAMVRQLARALEIPPGLLVHDLLEEPEDVTWVALRGADLRVAHTLAKLLDVRVERAVSIAVNAATTHAASPLLRHGTPLTLHAKREAA